MHNADHLLAWADRRRYILFILIALLYLAGFNGQWRITPDSADTAVTARHLVQTGPAENPLPGTALANRTLSAGLTYLMAGSFACFGVGVFWPAVTIMLLLAGVGLVATYWWIRLAIDRPTAVVVTCLVAVNYIYYTMSFSLLTDLPFAVGLVVFLLGEQVTHMRRWPALIGGGVLIIAGLALMALFRSVVVVVIAAILVTCLWRIVCGPGRSVAAAIVLLAIATYLGIRIKQGYATSPNPDEAVALHWFGWIVTHPWQLIREHLPMLVTYGLPRSSIGIELIWPVGMIVSLLIIIALSLLTWRRLLWGALAFGFILEIFLFRDAFPRYFLPIMPLMALAWWQMARRIDHRVTWGWGKIVFAAMLVVWMIPNLVRAGDMVVKQHRTPFEQRYEHGDYVAIHEVGNYLKRRFADHPSEAKDGVLLLIQLHDRGMLNWWADQPAGKFQAYAQDAAWRNIPQDMAVYVVTPAPRDFQTLLKRRGWHLGPTIFSAKQNDGLKDLQVHRLERSSDTTPPLKQNSRMSQR